MPPAVTDRPTFVKELVVYGMPKGRTYTLKVDAPIPTEMGGRRSIWWHAHLEHYVFSDAAGKCVGTSLSFEEALDWLLWKERKES
jgi:hypothetical protein